MRPFLYTIPQVASLVNVREDKLKERYIFFFGTGSGQRPTNRLMARNINPEENPPEWRITENELVRWMRFMGFKVVEERYLDT